ncbi:MAG: chemotaxis protein CheW, partial [bacterium]|nr:chemotaxis protein CheW [bacterium]
MNSLDLINNNFIVKETQAQNLFLSFKLGENKYAINVSNVVEIMNLPQLDYPQKLYENIVGLLNYNDFNINVLDLRFYLNIKPEKYSVSTKLLIVKTDEMFFGLIIDKAEDIISVFPSKIEEFVSDKKLTPIQGVYYHNDEILSVIDANLVEQIIKEGVEVEEYDVLSLFPQDDEFKNCLALRNTMLQEKNKSKSIVNIFSQDEYISFAINKNVYCINLEYVKEFVKNSQIIKIPCGLDYIKGVTSLRGDFITVVSISDFIDEKDYSIEDVQKKNNIIILHFADYKI